MTSTLPTASPIKPPVRDFVEDRLMQWVSVVGSGLQAVCGSRARGRFGILMYHRVAQPTPGIAQPTINVSPTAFARQIQQLLRGGYSIWPLQRLLDHWNRGDKIPPRTTAITFDDGFQGVYEHVAPVLREHEVSATVFLNTAYLDQQAPFPFDHWGLTHQQMVPPADYRPLTTEQCLELSDAGLIDFGAHTHTHQDFRGRAADLQDDVEENLRHLAKLFGATKYTFALPFGTPSMGYATEDMIAAVKRAGVTCCLNTESILNDSHRDPFHWGRFNVFPWDSGRTIAARLGGWYSWAPQTRQRLRRFLGKACPYPNQTVETAP